MLELIVATISTISSLLLSYFTTKNEFNRELRKIYRVVIITMANAYLSRKCVTSIELNNLFYLVDCYEKAGGNGYVHKLIEEVKKLEVRD